MARKLVLFTGSVVFRMRITVIFGPLLATQALPTARINLSPFTKDFCVSGALLERFFSLKAALIRAVIDCIIKSVKYRGHKHDFKCGHFAFSRCYAHTPSSKRQTDELSR